MRVQQSNHAGFSLVELVIVCAIIGVVAAIAFASFANRDEGSRLAQNVASRIRARRPRINRNVELRLSGQYPNPSRRLARGHLQFKPLANPRYLTRYTTNCFQLYRRWPLGRFIASKHAVQYEPESGKPVSRHLPN